MPIEPRGEKRPAYPMANTLLVAKIATGARHRQEGCRGPLRLNSTFNHGVGASRPSQP